MLELITVLIIDTGVKTDMKHINKYAVTCEPVYNKHGTEVAGVILYGKDINKPDPVCDKVKLEVCSVDFDQNMTDDYVACLKRMSSYKYNYVNISVAGNEYIKNEKELFTKSLYNETKIFVAAGNKKRYLIEEPEYPAALFKKAMPGFYPVGSHDYSHSNYAEFLYYETGYVSMLTTNNKVEFLVGTSFSSAVLLHNKLKEHCQQLEK